jgi:hypothetical protein
MCAWLPPSTCVSVRHANCNECSCSETSFWMHDEGRRDSLNSHPHVTRVSIRNWNVCKTLGVSALLDHNCHWSFRMNDIMKLHWKMLSLLHTEYCVFYFYLKDHSVNDINGNNRYVFWQIIRLYVLTNHTAMCSDKSYGYVFWQIIWLCVLANHTAMCSDKSYGYVFWQIIRLCVLTNHTVMCSDKSYGYVFWQIIRLCVLTNHTAMCSDKSYGYVFWQIIRNIRIHSVVKMHRFLMLHKVVHRVTTEIQMFNLNSITIFICIFKNMSLLLLLILYVQPAHCYYYPVNSNIWSHLGLRLTMKITNKLHYIN